VIEATIETDDDPFGSAASGVILRISGPLLDVDLTPKSPPKTSKPQTAQERKADLIRLMSQIDPDYKEGNIVSLAISHGVVPNDTNLDVDVANGGLAIEHAESKPLPRIVPRCEREFELNLGQHEAKVSLDERLDIQADAFNDLVFMPVLCLTDIDRVHNREGIEIGSIRGLILAQTGKADV
jgi:hypothetical protein